MSQDPGKARDTALSGALTQIERQFGKGTVMRMGDEGAQVKADAIPTGALSLDLAPGSGAATRGERRCGKGTVMRMGDEGAQVKVDAIPTGALSLDLALGIGGMPRGRLVAGRGTESAGARPRDPPLGIGGMPRGRIVEVYGPESSGKTTLVYHVLAQAQKLGGVCAFIDAEHAMGTPHAPPPRPEG